MSCLIKWCLFTRYTITLLVRLHDTAEELPQNAQNDVTLLDLKGIFLNDQSLLNIHTMLWLLLSQVSNGCFYQFAQQRYFPFSSSKG